MPAPTPVRVVIKLPYNRPENAPPDPPKIEWTPEKADILWKVIEIQRTRAVDSAGADWKGLAAHLEVPLPYLLYRVNARFQEEIRGLKDIQGALSPTAQHNKAVEFPLNDNKPPSLASRMMANDNHLSNSRSGAGTPMGIRARLNSLTNNVTPRQKKASISSSTLTLQAARKPFASMRPASPFTSGDESGDSSDEDAAKEEEAERLAEEEEALSRKLAELQKMMTNETLGLVSGTRPKPKARDRGRSAPMSPRSVGSYRQDAASNSASVSASRSASQSISSTSSPQDSIPDIPSPSSERSGSLAVPHSPGGRNMTGIASSPPRFSGRNPLLQRRYGPLVDRTSEIGSSHGSDASSFSDLSDASISASLEDAFMSNFGNGSNASHFSHFTRSRLSNRTHSSVPQ